MFSFKIKGITSTSVSSSLTGELTFYFNCCYLCLVLVHIYYVGFWDSFQNLELSILSNLGFAQKFF